MTTLAVTPPLTTHCGLVDQEWLEAILLDVEEGANYGVDDIVCVPGETENAMSVAEDGVKLADELASWVGSGIRSVRAT